MKDDSQTGAEAGHFRPADLSAQPRHVGFETLLRAEHRSSLDGLNVALVGVPSDFTVFVNGTRFGPAQIRQASRLTRHVDFETKLAPFEMCTVADVGDAPVHPIDITRQNELLQEFFTRLVERGISPLAFGGDHGITLPILRALGSRQRGLGLLQVDAHPDTFDNFLGSAENQTTFVRRLVEEEVLDPARVVIVGVRNTMWAPDQLDWAHEQGITTISADAFFAMGLEAASGKVQALLGAGPSYLTLDIDGLDPSEAPGTGIREPGGLRYRDVYGLVRDLWGHPVVGADVVEVCPPLDPSGRTAVVAANLAFQALCALACARARRS